LGKKGWYEEYFGAIPTNKTKSLIKSALKSVSLTPEIIERLSQRSWGNEKDLQTLSNEAVKLIHSDWIITRETIESYPIQIQIQTLTKTQPKTIGGGLRNTRAIFNRKKKAYQDAELKALCIKERVRLQSRGGF
jgi:hypothetical protein